MNVGNVTGSLLLAREHPQLIRPFAVHLLHRLAHKASIQVDGRVHAPEQITIVTTDRCNLRCKMCHYAFSDAPGYSLGQAGDMPPQLFFKVLDELPGHPIFTFTGGEPLLNRHLPDFIAVAHARGCLTTLTTNGWLLPRQAADLCAAGLDALIVSVDGPQAVHDAIRGGRSFARLAAGIEAVRRLPERPVLMISMTISNHNQDQLWAVYELARQWGVDGLNFNHLWMQTEEMIACQLAQLPSFDVDEVAWDVDLAAINVDLLADQLERIRAANHLERMLVTELPWLTREQIRTWYRDTARFVKYASTRCAWIRMKVWPNGDVKPCREWVVGNVAEEHVMDVWHNARYEDFRRLLAERGAIPICSRCCYMTYR